MCCTQNDWLISYKVTSINTYFLTCTKFDVLLFWVSWRALNSLKMPLRYWIIYTDAYKVERQASMPVSFRKLSNYTKIFLVLLFNSATIIFKTDLQKIAHTFWIAWIWNLHIYISLVCVFYWHNLPGNDYFWKNFLKCLLWFIIHFKISFNWNHLWREIKTVWTLK